MNYYVYALRSIKDKNLYIGLSNDPERRLLEHNQGMTRSTSSRRPFELIYTESCKNREQARKRELYFKSGIGREFLRTLPNPKTQWYLPAGRQGAAVL